MLREEMQRRKRELGLTYEQISRLSGVPLGTVQKILYGYTTSPRYDTLLAIEKVLGEDLWVAREGETLPAYKGKRDGEYTIGDRAGFPEDQRCELIDGRVYDLDSPSVIHQDLVLEIVSSLRAHVRGSGGPCKVCIAPLDVVLGDADDTVVQPDVMVVCDPDKVGEDRINGAPDFIAEVLSPATLRKDKLVKFGKYEESGVREYWIVDPVKRAVLVYRFEGAVFSAIYPFKGPIPVGIWDGRCEVDLSAYA